MFVPGNSKRFIDKAKTLDADIICFDLEDSVPINEKDNARKTIIDAVAKKTQYKSDIYVRINSLESGLAFVDLDAMIQEGVDGIVIPKVNDENEVYKIENVISSYEEQRGIVKCTIKLIPSIESAKGVVNAYSIAKSIQRINALIFGVFDYLHDMHLDYIEDDGVEYRYARAKIPIDARAAGLVALDSIWQKVDDVEGLREDANIARRLGYSGKTIIHPSQIEPVHKIFKPSKNEIEWAKKVVEALREPMEIGSGKKGAVKLEGKMIDAVHYKQAKAILNTIDEDNI
jgi:citrate lyase subunit beta/citryl-CoA lyase